MEILLQYLKEKTTNIDYHELEEVINNNYFEIELRHRLLQLTALKILYSATNIDLGYKRATRFINEMNQELGLLLTTDEIDSIYKTYQRRKRFIRNRYVKENYSSKKNIPKGEKVLVRKPNKRVIETY